MRSTNRRIARNLICLTALFVCASVPLAAQQGIDLLDAEQVLRGGASDGTVTVRAVLDEAPTGVGQATHPREEIQYDDGEFENFAANSPLLPNDQPRSDPQHRVEWAQRFMVKADGTVVSARVCFLRPAGDTSRAVDFSLRFYEDDYDTVKKANFPGRRTGLRYTIEEDIRRAGDPRCILLRGHLVGKSLRRGAHWVGIEWNPATRKRLAGDHYTADDEAETDRNGAAEHETEIRRRDLPVSEGAPNDGWLEGRLNRAQTTRGLKAIGVRLVLETTHAADPDPDPDPGPDPDPDPGPDPDPDPDPGRITPPPTGSGYSDCRPTVAPLTFEGNVKVSLCYETPTEKDDARAVYQSKNSGLLYFFDRDNAEVFVKVLDGCSRDHNGHRWVYVAALTDVSFNLYINDGQNPMATKAYHNRSGENHELVQDLMAFPCAR